MSKKINETSGKTEKVLNNKRRHQEELNEKENRK